MADAARSSLSLGSLTLMIFTRVRSMLGIVVASAVTIVASSIVIAVSFLGKHELATSLIHSWARACLKVFGIGVSVHGEESLPAVGGGIVVFNHQSLFDIPVLMVSTAKNIRFGAKIELFKLPIFGAAMRACGTLPIARENRAEVLKIYKAAEIRFKRNTLFVLAPEGTRQKEPAIGKFKKGPFLFAINAGVPIIPVVLKGTHAVLPKKTMHINVGRLYREIKVEYLPAISTKGLTPIDVDGIVEKTRADMVAVYERTPIDYDP